MGNIKNTQTLGNFQNFILLFRLFRNFKLSLKVFGIFFFQLFLEFLYNLIHIWLCRKNIIIGKHKKSSNFGKLSHYTVYHTQTITNLGYNADEIVEVPHTSSPDNNSLRRSVRSSGPSKSCSGRVGSRQSPCVSHRGHWGSKLSRACVCSG